MRGKGSNKGENGCCVGHTRSGKQTGPPSRVTLVGLVSLEGFVFESFFLHQSGEIDLGNLFLYSSIRFSLNNG